MQSKKRKTKQSTYNEINSEVSVLGAIEPTNHSTPIRFIRSLISERRMKITRLHEIAHPCNLKEIDISKKTNLYSDLESIEISDDSSVDEDISEQEMVISAIENDENVVSHRMGMIPYQIQNRLHAQVDSNANSIVLDKIAYKSRGPEHEIGDDELKKSPIYATRLNYKTWEWQPNINLKRLTENVLENNDKHGSHGNGSKRENVPVSPIAFDSDSDFIRELSPETAAIRFRRVIFFFN